MSSELRTGRTDSPTPSGDQSTAKIFIIAGVASEGTKRKLISEIIQTDIADKLSYVDIEYPDEYALGSLADYRSEIYHALRRFFAMREWNRKGYDIIVSKSLIDSWAWMVVNSQRKTVNGTLNQDEAALYILSLTEICIDSFDATHIFMVDDPQTDLDRELYDKMDAFVDRFIVPKSYDLEAKEIAKVIESYYE